MRRFRLGVFLMTLGWMASSAMGQGLYGAPQMLPLAPAAPLNVSPPAYLSPSGSASAPAAYASMPPAYAPIQSPQYPQTQTPAPATYGPGLVAPNPNAWNRTPPPTTPGYHGNYPYRVAAANPPGPAPSATLTPPITQPLAPIPQSAPGQHPMAPMTPGPMYEQPGYGSGCSSCRGGCRSIGELFGCGYDPCYQPRWYVSGTGLFLTRDEPNGVWTTLDSATQARLMQTTDAKIDWRGGYEVKLGGRFGPANDWAIEGDYWTVDRFSGSAGTPLGGAAVSTPLAVNGIDFAGINGNAFFNNAAGHRLLRTDRLQSAEVNLVHRFGESDPYCWPMFDFAVSAGPRYFQFDEALTFGGLTNGATWGASGGVNEAYLNERVFNTLIGVQVGLDAGYHLARTFRLFVDPKLGFYNNHIETRFDALRGDGVRAVPQAGGSYPVYADTNSFSFLAQIDAGLDWQFTPQWTAFLGYRLVAATGIGLADHQLPANVVDFTSLNDVKRNGNLLVHGAFAGLKVEF